MDFRKRLAISWILPQEDTFDNMIIVQDISDKVKLTQKEMEETGFKVIDTDGKGKMGVSWDDKKEKDVKIEFTNPEKNLIKDALKKLSEEKKIGLDLIPLYKEFV